MPSYRIFRLKEQVRQNFRWQPHLSGLTTVKPKDYEPAETVEAATPYALWMALKDTEQALGVGDILEIDGNDLRIVKYVGFEEARWVVPESKVVEVGAGVVAAQAAGQAPVAAEVQ